MNRTTTELFNAARTGDLDTVEEILQDYDDPINIDWALTHAASGGHLNIVRYLVEQAGATNFRRAFNNTSPIFSTLRDYLLQRIRETSPSFNRQLSAVPYTPPTTQHPPSPSYTPSSNRIPFNWTYGECPVCMEPLENNLVLLSNCKHIFHKECTDNVVGKLCPLCRAPYTFGLKKRSKKKSKKRSKTMQKHLGPRVIDDIT